MRNTNLKMQVIQMLTTEHKKEMCIETWKYSIMKVLICTLYL